MARRRLRRASIAPSASIRSGTCTGGLVVAVAFYAELRGSPTVSHPFAAGAIAPGDPLEAHLEWHDVPAGLLPLPDVTGATAAVAIAAREPILPSHLGPPFTVPAGWWSVPLSLPPDVAPGTSVRVVVAEPPIAAAGIVTGATAADEFGLAGTGLVAVPGAAADEIARAGSRGEVMVLIAP